MIPDPSATYARAQSSYHDFQGLRDLRQGAQRDDPEALKEVARQFEALFIQMILKSARDADQLIGGEDGLFNSNEMSFFQGMLDEQFSLAMAQANGGQGMGLADVLVQQLARTLPDTEEAVASAAQAPESIRRGAATLTQDVMERLVRQRLENAQAPYAAAANPSETDRQAAAQAIEAAQRPPMQAAGDVRGREPLDIPGLPVRADKRAYFSSPAEFVRRLYPYAQQAAERLGVDPRLMLAQSALETGWGRHMIPREDGSNSFNLFGIKADRRWEGESAEVQTLEYRNGQPQSERWPFRAYESFEQSMQDYVDFLQSNPRYRHALEQAENPRAFARGLQQAGYATDPRYANKILNIMDGATLNQALEEAGLE